MPEYLEVTYRLHLRGAAAEARADAVLLEQTIETPRSVAARYPQVQAGFMGELVDLEPCADGTTRARLALPWATAQSDPAQFVNVLFGNSSIHADVELEDFTVPPSLASLFPGPAFGMVGVRQQLGVPDRALTCAALKPVGLTVSEVAGLCHTFAEGGVDLIKDDHYLADHPFCPFEARIVACQQAVGAAAEKTGHRAVYVPNLSGTPEQVFGQAAIAQQHGVGAVMVAPMLLGLPTLHALVARLDVPVLAHPSFAGAARIHPPTLYGKLLRLYGADAMIFTNYGGRFGFSRETCVAIAEAARQPWQHLRPAFPVPAGGMTVERVPELLDAFGPDTILLIGGSLLEAGEALLERTCAFTETVAAHADA